MGGADVEGYGEEGGVGLRALVEGRERRRREGE